jgi:hypothetical protein
MTEAGAFRPNGLRPESPGGLNGSVQHLLQLIGWRFEAQGLSRALIEPQGNRLAGMTDVDFHNRL